MVHEDIEQGLPIRQFAGLGRAAIAVAGSVMGWCLNLLMNLWLMDLWRG